MMYLAVQSDTILKLSVWHFQKLSGFVALAEGCIIVVKSDDMWGWYVAPMGRGRFQGSLVCCHFGMLAKSFFLNSSKGGREI